MILKTACREKKLGFAVREFTYNTETIQKGKEDKKKLETQKETQKNKLILWCKTNFTEAFVAWTHLKAIRIFVESILRYGLPANFQAVLVLPNKKGDDKKVRNALFDLFKHLASKHLEGDTEEQAATSEKFYPYVSLTINIEMKTT